MISVPHRQTFRKRERLCSRKVIQDLVQKGRNIHVAPIRLTWMKTTLVDGVHAQTAFSVSKKKFKNATDRNRIKRRMREAFRKNKYPFYTLLSKLNIQYALLLVFSGNVIPSYNETEEKTILILQQLAETIKKNNN